jgi:hypothetical protein
MRLHQLALVAALAMSVPAALAAQTTDQNGTTRTQTGGTTTTQTGSSTGTQTTTTATQTTTTTATTSQTTTPDTYSDHAPSRWMASGFIGSNYSNNSAKMPGGVTSSSVITTAGGTITDTSDDNSFDLGFSVGYLWRSVVGAEFLAGFTPDFNLANSLISSEASPEVNTYMFNAVGAVPLGADGRLQPYVSGGFGGITLRGATLASGLSTTRTSSSSNNGNAVSDVFDPDESRGGGDIGAGIMAFMGNWGVRGDVRYFRAFSNNEGTISTSTSTSTTASGTTSSSVVTGLLPGLDFWRANIGIALRW